MKQLYSGTRARNKNISPKIERNQIAEISFRKLFREQKDSAQGMNFGKKFPDWGGGN